MVFNLIKRLCMRFLKRCNKNAGWMDIIFSEEHPCRRHTLFFHNELQTIIIS